MFRILSIVTLIFLTPAMAGEVDGRSFYCESDTSDPPIALKFDFGGVESYIESELFADSTQPKYTTSPKDVRWQQEEKGKAGWGFLLNRKTLILLGGGVAQWQCAFERMETAVEKVKKYGMDRDKKAREGNKF